MSELDQSPVPDYRKLLTLEGRRYIVLGAGQGMGRQSAHALAQAGARVLCVDVEAERAQHVAREVGGSAWVGDCTKREAVVDCVETAQRQLGGLDGFVDIIGIAAWGGVLDIDDKSWDSQFDLNLRHAFLISQEAGRRMKASGGGTMVFVASVSGLSGAPNHAAYGAAKAGLMAWVQSLALELAQFNIRANAVAPGAILTPRMQAAFTPAQIEANHRNAPIGRMGQPSDIASAALYLSSPLSAYVTGRTLVVDGGVETKFPYTPSNSGARSASTPHPCRMFENWGLERQSMVHTWRHPVSEQKNRMKRRNQA